MTQKKGTLYGIGVGPGDPELITLKALKVLEKRPHIFAATSSKNTYSLALDIIHSHLNGAPVEQLPFPMTRDQKVLEEVPNGKMLQSMTFLSKCWAGGLGQLLIYI